MPAAIECVLLRPGREAALARFFTDLAAAGDDAYFHPHAGDVATLRVIAEQAGLDLYVVFVEGEAVRAYGLLRGWNEGYAIPSLGIAVHPDARACGLGSLMMEYLETMARHRGAPAIRLRVHQDNARAIAMYKRRGYALTPENDGARLLVGVKPLGDVA
ncbi:GNAT family N-acetyltransferase [Lysobacter niastensis]|uniref:GNAT family N-acetyltransferase n=1 Tax=Lysobacter niastensis TaxID=380629 RepID=A0ABS0BFZ9_9GAMM|nr:GNAT family N-acetyltransferase [Lysobacter niastensis]MBF6025874.1 GNAT family N-acetyltransferase [Lysobacter niastensis]